MLVPVTELFDPDLLLLVEAGQSGEYINLTLDKLNDNEGKVYDYILKQGGPTYLSDIWSNVFSGTDSKKANSWTRNALRRLVRSKFVNKIEKGVYTANKVSDDGYPEGVTDEEKATKKGAKKKKKSPAKPAEQPAAAVAPGLSDLSPAQVLAKLADGSLSKKPEDLLDLAKAGFLSKEATVSALKATLPGQTGDDLDFIVGLIHNDPNAPSAEKILATLKKHGTKKGTEDLTKLGTKSILIKVKDGEVSPEDATAELHKRYPNYGGDQLSMIVKSVAAGETPAVSTATLLKTYGGGTGKEPTEPTAAPEPAPAPAGEPPSVGDIMKQLGFDGEPEEPAGTPPPTVEPAAPAAPAAAPATPPSKQKPVKSPKKPKGLSADQKAEFDQAFKSAEQFLRDDFFGETKSTEAVFGSIRAGILTGSELDQKAVDSMVDAWLKNPNEASEGLKDLQAGFENLYYHAQGSLSHLTALANASSGGDRLRAAVAFNALLSRRNTSKATLEEAVNEAYAKKGKKGTFTVAQGFVGEGASPDKPKTKIVTHSAEAIATGKGFEVQPFTPKGGAGADGIEKIVIKNSNNESPQQLRDFVVKELGISPDHIHGEKTGSNMNMIFVSKAEFDKVKKTEEVPIEPVHGASKYDPTPDQAQYFPAMTAVREATSNNAELADIDENTFTGYSGLRIKTDGGAVEGQHLNVRKMEDSQGPYFAVQLKLRKGTWSQLTSGGYADTYSFNTGTYDADKGVFKVDPYGSAVDSCAARKWSFGSSSAHLLTEKYSYKGMVMAKVRPAPGQTMKEALEDVLRSMDPDLPEKVFKNPTKNEEFLAGANQYLWNQDASWANSHKSGASTGAAAKKLLEQRGIDPSTIQKAEILDGQSSFVQAGRWRSIVKDDAGKPAVSFVLFAASTPERVANMMRSGVIGINERNTTLQPKGNPASYESDVASGCADNPTFRLITKSGHEHGTTMGVSGEYKIIIAPDEVDRLDTFMADHDNYGRCTPTDDVFTSRVSLKHQIQKQQNNFHGSAEICFRKGVSSKKFLRVVCGSETTRATLIDAMKKAGLSDVNGVPVEDFVAVQTNCGQVYEKYVKPAGFP